MNELVAKYVYDQSISFDKPSLLTIKFKDGTMLELTETLSKDK